MQPAIKVFWLMVFLMPWLSGRSQSSCSFKIETEKLKVCAPAAVQFKGIAAEAAQTYKWIIGNDTVFADKAEMTYMFAEAGKFKVYAEAIYSTGQKCLSQNSFVISVNNIAPEADLSVSRTNISQPDTVTFTATGKGIQRFDWIIEGVNYSNAGTKIVHRFHSSGWQNITLRITDSFGCVSTKQFSQALYIKYPPVININPTVYGGCAPVFINYKLSVTQGESPIKSFSWFFEGASPSAFTGYNPPQIKYTQAGSFKVQLVVRTDDGSVYNFYTRSAIQIGEPVKIDFTASKTRGLEGDTITYTNTSSALGPGKFTWTTKGGIVLSQSNEKLVVRYINPGYYSVQLDYKHFGCEKKLLRENYVAIYNSDGQIPQSPCAGIAAQFYAPERACANTEISTVNYFKKQSFTYNWSSNSDDIKFLPGNTAEQPKIVATKGGTYIILLQVKNKSGCTASYLRKIIVAEPQVSFTTKDSFNTCAPAYVQFNVTATDADTFFWDFGDGTQLTTTSKQIAHLYNENAGLYKDGFTVTVTAKNNLGCSHTFVKENYVKVVGPVPMFTIEGEKNGSDSVVVTLKNTSYNVHRWAFDFGDNSQLDSAGVVKHVYRVQDPDKAYQVFKPRLIVNDANGCSAIANATDSIVVYRNAYIALAKNALSGCENVPLQIVNNSRFASKFYWDFNNDGTIDDTSAQPNRYFAAGTYNVKLIAENCVGNKVSTVFENLLNIAEKPAAKAYASTNAVCLGQSVTFYASAVNPNTTACTWYTDEHKNGVKAWSASFTFTKTAYQSGYAVLENEQGCNDTVYLQNAVYIIGSEAPAQPHMHSVNVESNNAVLIKWRRHPQPGISHYNLYRIENKQVTLIYTSKDFSDTSYMDVAVNASEKAYTYSIQAFDICGNQSSIDLAHTSIHLEAENNDFGIQLKWNGYSGFKPKYYNIYRSRRNSDFTLLTTLNGVDYIDRDVCDGVYDYYVEAVSIENITAASNRVHIKNIQPQLYSTQHLINSASIQEDNSVALQWQKPGLKKLKHFWVYAYMENSWQNVGSTTENNFVFTSANANKNPVQFMLKVEDSCGNIVMQSFPVQTMHLKVNSATNKTELQWTHYSKWQNGTKAYKIQIMNDDGSYKTLATVAATDSVYTDYNGNADATGAWRYRVLAVENSVETDANTSTSNAENTFLPSRLELPNAFTPNGDGLNDEFRVNATSLYRNSGRQSIDFHMLIYNRWGQLVYESNEPAQGWNGQFAGAPAESGAYSYSVYVTGLDGKIYPVSGTVLLLR